MIRTYSILKEYQLIIQCHKGTVNGEDLKKVKLAAVKNPDFSTSFNFLVDFRDTEIVMDNQELIEYEQWLLSHPVLKRINRFAIYTNSPSQVERAFEYIQHTGIRIDHYGIFTSLSSAMGWLQVQLAAKHTIEHCLSEIVKHPVEV